jgi:hypothetical protein
MHFEVPIPTPDPTYVRYGLRLDDGSHECTLRLPFRRRTLLIALPRFRRVARSRCSELRSMEFLGGGCYLRFP